MHLQMPHCVKYVGEQETVTFSATKHNITELGVYNSVSFFIDLDNFQTPFLTLKKARPFVVTLTGLQVFPCASFVRATQGS